MHQLEKAILKRVQHGDKDAFESLFNAYYSQLFNYAREILKDRDAAEEVVEDSFLRLWENRGHIHIETSIRAYLYRSVYNRCLNHLKHLKVRDKYRLYFTHHVTNPEYEASYSFDFPLSRLVNKELEKMIGEAIGKLPSRCREIFIMSRVEEMKHEKIAEKLGISQNTVKTQISRALSKLREELKEAFPFF